MLFYSLVLRGIYKIRKNFCNSFNYDTYSCRCSNYDLKLNEASLNFIDYIDI